MKDKIPHAIYGARRHLRTLAQAMPWPARNEEGAESLGVAGLLGLARFTLMCIRVALVGLSLALGTAVVGCGGSSSTAPQPTTTFFVGSSGELQLPNLLQRVQDGRPLNAQPYSVSCVTRRFSMVGVSLFDPFGEPVDGREGMAILTPSGGADLSVIVFDSPAHAARAGRSFRLALRSSKREPGVVLQDANVVATYRSPSPRIVAAMQGLATACA
jgi:hypothetical protein